MGEQGTRRTFRQERKQILAKLWVTLEEPTISVGCLWRSVGSAVTVAPPSCEVWGGHSEFNNLHTRSLGRRNVCVKYSANTIRKRAKERTFSFKERNYEDSLGPPSTPMLCAEQSGDLVSWVSKGPTFLSPPTQQGATGDSSFSQISPYMFLVRQVLNCTPEVFFMLAGSLAS